MVDLALSGVAETLLIPLYNRAMESERPDAIMKDEKSVFRAAASGIISIGYDGITASPYRYHCT